MRAQPGFVLKYAVFCGVAMLLNLGAQYAADQLLSAPFWISIGLGTGVGLFAKYILDRNYIFKAHGVSIAQDARRFGIYTAMGIVTTLVFWGVEWLFAALFPGSLMKYFGGGIGLTIGYILKYHLDRRWVFHQLTRETAG